MIDRIKAGAAAVGITSYYLFLIGIYFVAGVFRPREPWRY